MSDTIINDELDPETNLDPEIDILSLYTGEKDVYLQNWDAVNQLDRESDLLAKSIISGYGTSAILTLLSAINLGWFLVIGILTNAFFSQEYIWRVRRLAIVARAILERYGNDNMVVTPRVKTGNATIDLLVRMPDKRMFALAIRSSKDTSSVIWREDRQEFFIIKKGRSAKRAVALTKAIDSLQTIFDLKKVKHPLLGVTNSERTAPLTKAIVLAPGAKIVAFDDSPLWKEFGTARVLQIRTVAGVVYVVEADDLINFLQPVQKKDNSASI
jgi:hypothetical protein